METTNLSNGKNCNDASSGPCESSPNPPCAATEQDAKKLPEPNGTAGKKKRGNRRRDGQALTEILNSVDDIAEMEEKMRALARLVLASREETKEAKAAIKSKEARIVEVERERDAKTAEASKAILVRSQMESLCRELQRHNNTLQEKLRLRVREDEEKRKETANNFQTKLSEITTMIEDSNSRNNQLKEQNSEIREQLSAVVQRYSVREESVNKLLKTAEEQTKLAEERIQRTEKELTLSHELYKRDRETWLKLEEEYKNQIKLRELSETKLSAEVKIYSDKYQDFQDAFKKFQSEMSGMTKKIGAMEKESMAWRQRYEKTAATLFDVVKEKEAVQFNCEKLNRVIGTLQSLSRKLVEERDELRKVVETSNGNVALEQDKWERLIGDCSRRLKEAEELVVKEGAPATNGEIPGPVQCDSNSNAAEVAADS